MIFITLFKVVRNSDRPLTEAQIKSYMLMLLKGVAFCHENNIMHRVSVVVNEIKILTTGWAMFDGGI